MLYFIEAWSSAALFMTTFGILGVGLIAPFAEELPFAFLAAPLAAITFIPMVANAVYALAGLTYRSSLVVAVLTAAVVLIAGGRRLKWKHGLLQLLGAAAAVSLIALLACDARSVLLGGPAIFFKYGTDQSGYAQMGDWLLQQTIQVRPTNDGGVWPYQSWPEILFDIDPRFGSFGLLALVATVTKTHSLFAYPFATALVIGSATLSCSALFTRKPSTLLLCFIGLGVSDWIDYGYTGFFGRIIGYPSALYLVGFFFLALRGSPTRLASLLVIAAGAGTSYPGFVVGILAAAMIFPSVALRRLTVENRLPPGKVLAPLVIAIMVPFLSSGMASRPLGFGQIVDGLDWRTVLVRAIDIDDRSLPMTGLSSDTVMMFAAVSLIVLGVLIIVALARRHAEATGLLVGPLAFLGALALSGRVSSVQEFAGLPYPALVVGSILLLESLSSQVAILTFVCFIVQIAFRLPRFYAVITVFAYAPDPNFILTQGEVRQLEKDIGPRSVEIDTGTDIGRALWLMPELGPRADQVWWAPDTWRGILAYRPYWTYKAPPAPTQTRLTVDLTDDVRHHFKIEQNVQ